MLGGNQLERLFPSGCGDLYSHEKLETEADSEVDVWCDLSLFGMKSKAYSQLTWRIHVC